MAHDAAYDVIVVGSGPSGAHAAAEAVERGLRVALIDIGDQDEKYAPLIPAQPFSQTRRSDPQQARYFLGDALEGISVAGPKNVPHITPPHAYMLARSDRLFPLSSDTFFPIQSSARGGLAASWGGNCFTWEDFELHRAGLPESLRPLYSVVARAIGVSRPDDDLAPFLADVQDAQPPLDIDSNATAVLRAYEKQRLRCQARGFYMGRSFLALLSRDRDDGRRATPYDDMDYWSEHGESLYRPEYTLRPLRSRSNYQELRQRLVLRFDEPADGGVEVVCRQLEGDRIEHITARKLVLAAGALGSARLALSSLAGPGQRVPLLCNPNRKLACINLPMLGRPAADRRHSLSQLTLLLRSLQEEEDYLVGQIYSYRSLLYFRLVQEVPLPPWLSLQLLRLLGTCLTMVNVHHSDRHSPEKWLALTRTGEHESLQAHYALSAREQASHARNERRLLRELVRLGCIPLKMSHSDHGGSVHYGGTLPFASDARPMTCDPRGQLHPTRHVFVADGSTFNYLSAKGLTFTLMANARRVMAEVARTIAVEKAQGA